MRALLIEPGSHHSEIEVETYAALRKIIGAAIEVRPFTLTAPLLSIAMDENFVGKRLHPSLYHPTYRERYALCGPLVVFREHDGELMDLTESDVARAVAIVAEHAV